MTQEPPGYLKHVEEPGLAERLRACFDPKGFEQNPRDISGEVKAPRCRRASQWTCSPAPSTEYPMGGMTILKGNSTNYTPDAEVRRSPRK